MGNIKENKIIIYLIMILVILSTFNIDKIDAKEMKNTNKQERKGKDIKITGGYDFSTVQLEDGSVWSWGANEHGQLGLGDTDNRLQPTKLDTELENKNIKKMESGDQTMYALTDTGEVYLWGKEVRSLAKYTKPKNLDLKIKVKDVASVGVVQSPNNHRSVAFLGEDGRVYVIGSAYYSQAGRGLDKYGSSGNCTKSYDVSKNTMKPVLTTSTTVTCSNDSQYKKVTDGNELSNVKLLSGSTNGRNFVAITETNDVYTWGQGYSTLAVKNPNGKDITGNIEKVIVTTNNIYALTDKKEVWTWTGKEGKPSKLNVSDVKDIAGYSGTILILKENGDAYGKGNNDYGQLGKGLNTSNLTKLAVKDVDAIGMGHRHSLFANKDGKIFGMGWNSYRQLADKDDGVHDEFIKMPTLSGVDHIATNEYTTYAVKDNQLYAWGELLGSGDFGSTTNKPRKIEKGNFNGKGNVKNIKGSSFNYFHTSITMDNGDVYTWGHDYRDGNGHNGARSVIGKLEHDPNNNAYTPNTINGVTYVVKDKITLKEINLVDSVQGAHSGVAVDKTGQLLSWGMNQHNVWGVGELQRWDWGTSGIAQKSSKAFIKVKSDEKFKQVDGRKQARIALSRDGQVYTWGEESSYALGRDGDNSLPMKITSLTDITDVNMGYITGLVLDKSGDLYSWGRNNEGQVGNGSINDVERPIKITSNITEKFTGIESGQITSYAISEKGDLYAWGSNKYGQLGLGDRTTRTSPRKVKSFPHKVKQVTGGKEHTVVLLENGDVYVAGNDAYGQLGLNKDKNIIEYKEIPFPDYIELTTDDNQEFEMNDTLIVTGSVTSVLGGSNLRIRYDVESSNGIVENGVIDEYTSTTSKKNFTHSIKLDKKYGLGGYTVNVYVENIATNQSNKSGINFGVFDKTPPTLTVTSEYTKKTVHPITLKATATDNESGIKRIQLPNGEWKTGVTDVQYKVTKNGTYTFIAEDNSGNTTEKSIKVTNILDKKEMELEIPTVSSLDGITLTNKEETYVMEQVEGIEISDYRISSTDWRLEVGATQLESEKGYKLPKGTMKINMPTNVNSTGEGETTIPTIQKGQGNVDTEKVVLVKGYKSTDFKEYTIDLPKELLEITINPTSTKVGKYHSKLTWDIIEAP